MEMKMESYPSARHTLATYRYCPEMREVLTRVEPAVVVHHELIVVAGRNEVAVLFGALVPHPPVFIHHVLCFEMIESRKMTKILKYPNPSVPCWKNAIEPSRIFSTRK